MAAAGLEWDALNECRILVVDDQPLVRSLIGSILKATGLTALAFAVDGEDALAQVGGVRPDLIVLDLMMPRMDGFAVLERLRGDPVWADVPVLVLTAADDHEVRGRVFAAGATDFVMKPLERREFLARVKVHLSARMLVQRLETQLRRIDRELKDAQRMQVGLLPPPESLEAIERTMGIAVRHHFECSSIVGGDYWTVRPLGEHTLGVLICDFSGHGVSAAMNTVRLHTLLAEYPVGDPADPAAYLTLLNNHLLDLLACEQFATLLFGVVDTRADTFTYAAAACPEPFIGTAGNGAVERLDGSGLPLGLAREAGYQNVVVPFPPGHFLFLYSDALYEGVSAPRGTSQRRLFFEAFSRLIAEGAGEPVLPRVLDWFFARSPRPPEDDLTAVWLERLS